MRQVCDVTPHFVQEETSQQKASKIQRMKAADRKAFLCVHHSLVAFNVYVEGSGLNG